MLLAFRAVNPAAHHGKATYFVGRARAATLFQFDEQDAAVAIIALYAYGEKPEEVEVGLGSAQA
jgi:hypothetical protein